MPERIIFDTDPGVDDAMALYFALRSPELEIVGLTTVFGNGPVDLTTLNALRLLEIAGRPDIPVARGAAGPLSGVFHHGAGVVHGVDGQGDVFLPHPQTRPLPVSAADFIVERVLAEPGALTLLAVGPLTNLALALEREPRIAGLVRRVVLMGGNAFVPGNITPAAEANIYNDVEAADRVFAADWPVTMIGLDVTQRTVMSATDLGRYAAADNALAAHLARITPFYLNFTRGNDGIDGIFVHDSTAVAYLVCPEAFTIQRHRVRVETQGFASGKTWPARSGVYGGDAWDGRPEVEIAVAVDGARTVALELARVCGDRE